jgi:valyl-tRNA synthetase
MELNNNFIPAEAEGRWYQHWLNKEYFNSYPNAAPAYTVVIPPPNVTGVLHMGHTLNETVQDILVRHARMHGFNACWVPGSDHASIATEAKVVQMLREKGIEKASLTREKFLEYAFEWKDKYGGIIYEQIKKLGCSVDWNRVNFTMDDHYYSAVIKVFADFHQKGLIYRGARMINWDPAAKTALSDEEVEYKDLTGKLYYVRYRITDAGGNAPATGIPEYITIATQRPETIMGDTAICVNPQDERFASLKNHKAIVPLVNRIVPIIFDEYVDPTFGTGALKVTPAHDINDYNLGIKHNLEIINTLNEDGTLSEASGVFIGEDRFKARKKVVETLTTEGLLVKEEEYATRLGYSQRTGVVIEPRISTQWFVKMKDISQPALEAVTSGKIRIHPGDKFLATYKHWLENVKDWCISRQLWWGQRIPAWYDASGNCYVAENSIGALEAARKQNPNITEQDLSQDPDVLDTWFSSWLWPIEVFNGITKPGNEEINYYYPTATLVTGQDIIFFWVARMVMAGMEYMKEIPFKDVYFTGMVRDKQGRKMSKQLGNSPDLLELIDRFGADAVRFGIMISSPAGNDLLFDESSLDQGRNFNNKMWNALKLVTLWQKKLEETTTGNPQHTETIRFATQWFESRLSEATAEVELLISQFRLSEALKLIYSLVWDDFCSWYLEWVKPAPGETPDSSMIEHTIGYLEQLVELLHPYMPFITEEIYHLLKERAEGDDLCIRQKTKSQPVSKEILLQGARLKQLITAIRDGRNKNRLKPKDVVTLAIDTATPATYAPISNILCRQVNADQLSFTSEAPKGSVTIVSENDKIYLQSPALEEDGGQQKETLEKELAYQKGFLASVEKKLGNEKFVQNAKPEIIAAEQKKKSDALERIRALEESLAQ